MHVTQGANDSCVLARGIRFPCWLLVFHRVCTHPKLFTGLPHHSSLEKGAGKRCSESAPPPPPRHAGGSFSLSYLKPAAGYLWGTSGAEAKVPSAEKLALSEVLLF